MSPATPLPSGAGAGLLLPVALCIKASLRATLGSYPIASSEQRAFRRTGTRPNVEPLRGSDGGPTLDDVGLATARMSAATTD